MIRDFRNKISFYVFIVNKLKFLYFSIDIDEPTALDPIAEEGSMPFSSVTKGTLLYLFTSSVQRN